MGSKTTHRSRSFAFQGKAFQRKIGATQVLRPRRPSAKASFGQGPSALGRCRDPLTVGKTYAVRSA
jgi:hypothetical protein